MKVTNLIANGGAILLAAALVITAGAREPMRPAAGASSAQGGEQKETAPAFRLKAAAFEDGGWIPKENTCDGASGSPALAWGEPPAGTHSFALIVDDPDARASTWVHWVLYNLPGRARALPEGVPNGAELPDGTRQGQNDSGKIGYSGPCPPPGRVHHYYFKLYALDGELTLAPDATKSELEQAMASHVVAQTEIVGRFQR
jgi:Raf kinase inhibitor-like YbhB/YbcL family protein